MGLLPFTGFSGCVLIITEALGPSPICVSAARVVLYLDPGVKFSNLYFNKELDML